MKFCAVCNNMLYLSLHPDDETRLMYHCKNCAFEVDVKDAVGDNHTAVLGRNYIDDETKYQQFVNPNIKYDPTLPRLNTIECANPACTKPQGRDNEVIYVKYDHTNMKFMYYCCFCETFWKSKERK